MYKLMINGIVQGVGFRPFIYKLAVEEDLKGFVLNNTGGVEIIVEGDKSTLQRFMTRIKSELPPAAKIESVSVRELPDRGYNKFEIKLSTKGNGSTLISPDLAVCDDCIREFSDPDDFRYHYSFINCTNCGPRYSIIKETPYDRPVTSMRDFNMCNKCRSEYTNPLDRRFHAQPIACQECGPELQFIGKDLKSINGDPIQNTIDALKQGKIVGIKGIGGFHLACDATNFEAIAEMRRRKNRPDKPFAIMANESNLAEIVEFAKTDLVLLRSTIAPIVILPKRSPSILATNLAPFNPNIGVFLPYAPHHYQIVDEKLPFLIMTSGNLQDEPIAKDAFELQQICDFFLTHNRPILNRSDDSIILPTGKFNVLLRRSRGYVPTPIQAPFPLIPTLACGAELKLTFALSNNKEYFLSPYIGNSGSKATMDFYEETLQKYKRWFNLDPELVVCDLQPDFTTTKLAEAMKLPLVKVQHHHAHTAAIMAEHGLDEKVIGISYDGTGFGTDKAIWGGEILIANYENFERIYHLEYMPLPGGDASIKHPIRIAYAYLRSAGIDTSFLTGIPSWEQKVISKQLVNNFNVFQTSSMGRLFDCVAAMLDLYPNITFEAQSAMALEFLCENEDVLQIEPFSFHIKSGLIGIKPLLRDIAEAIKNKAEQKIIAKRFHRTILEFTLVTAQRLRRDNNLNKIVLSGGVMQNKLIVSGLAELLVKNDFEVYRPQKLPANDGSISVGQLMIANRINKNKMEK
ncbi:MAG: carbamoyltransferase HypF [Candidatus Cloacimonetes bacterium]|nr:carbamoyltransferase HypF [Candidatus Cloacimonadota bacterium]